MRTANDFPTVGAALTYFHLELDRVLDSVRGERKLQELGELEVFLQTVVERMEREKGKSRLQQQATQVIA